jgi:hypothetical protein
MRHSILADVVAEFCLAAVHATTDRQNIATKTSFRYFINEFSKFSRLNLHYEIGDTKPFCKESVKTSKKTFHWHTLHDTRFSGKKGPHALLLPQKISEN